MLGKSSETITDLNDLAYAKIGDHVYIIRETTLNTPAAGFYNCALLSIVSIYYGFQVCLNSNNTMYCRFVVPSGSNPRYFPWAKVTTTNV